MIAPSRKEAGSRKLLVFDTQGERSSIISSAGDARCGIRGGAAGAGDFAEGPYAHVQEERAPVRAAERAGQSDRGQAVRLVKRSRSQPAATGFDVRYRVETGAVPSRSLRGRVRPRPPRGNAPDRYLLHGFETSGLSWAARPPSVRVGARDEWSNLEIGSATGRAGLDLPLGPSLFRRGRVGVSGTIVLPRWQLRLGPARSGRSPSVPDRRCGGGGGAREERSPHSPGIPASRRARGSGRSRAGGASPSTGTADPPECLARTRGRALDPLGRVRAIVNNLEKIGFNFGPTLLEWLESGAGHLPEDPRADRAARPIERPRKRHRAGVPP
jgi:hypothetical protein